MFDGCRNFTDSDNDNVDWYISEYGQNDTDHESDKSGRERDKGQIAEKMIH